MQTTIVTPLCDVRFGTPNNNLTITLELLVFRTTHRLGIEGRDSGVTVSRKLRATTKLAERTDYVAQMDVTRTIDSLPARAEDLVATDLAIALIRELVEGLLEKAKGEGERTGEATLGPPTHLAAEDLEELLRQLGTE